MGDMKARVMQYLQQLDHNSQVPTLDTYLRAWNHAEQDMTVIGDKVGPTTTPVRDDDEDTTGQQVQQASLSLCISCTCSSLPFPAQELADHEMSTSSDSDSDSDQEELALDKMLNMIKRLQRNQEITSATRKNLGRLVSFVNLQTIASVTDDQINQISTFLASDHQLVKEMSLKVIEQLLSVPASCCVVLQRQEVVNQVIDLSIDNIISSLETQVSALGVLDKVLRIPELDYTALWETLDKAVFPELVHILHGSPHEELKYAACCVLRTLAREIHFAERIKTDSMFMLQQLRDSSYIKLKKAYVGVLTALFAHPGLTDAGSVDTGVLPIVRGLLKDGPCAMCDGHGVEAVIEDQRLIAYTLACLVMSRCRKVRASASVVFKTFTTVQRKSAAQKVMEGASYYVQPESVLQANVGGGIVAKVKKPSQPRSQVEVRLWHNMDSFLDSVAGLIRKEAMLQIDSDHLTCHLPVKGGVSQERISCLTHLVQVVTNMCCWPLRRLPMGPVAKQISKEELDNLCEDVTFSKKYSRFDHRLTMEQWSRFGSSLFAILRWLSQHITQHVSSMSSSQSSQSSVTTLASSHSSSAKLRATPGSSRPGSARPQQSTVCSSERSHSSTSRPSSAKPHTSSEASRSTASTPSCSSSTRPVSVNTEDVFSEAECELLVALLHFTLGVSIITCRQILDPLQMSDDGVSGDVETGPQPKKSNSKLSVADASKESASGGGDSAHKYREMAERGALSDRLGMRRGLYNEGLFHILAPLLQLADPQFKKLCGLILRTVIQPVGEKQVLIASASKPEVPHWRIIHTTSKEKGEQNQYCSSPHDFSLCYCHLKMPLTLAMIPPAEVQPTGVAVHHTPDQTEVSRSPAFRCKQLVAGQPVSRECQKEAVSCCAAEMIQGLFCRQREVKKLCLLFLHDVVKYTTTPVLMKLSKLGVMPKLLDFIRVSDNDEELAVIGLIVVEMLIQGDDRLWQLFSRHGGHNLLMAFTKHSNMFVRAQVGSIFTTLKRLGGKGDCVQTVRSRQFSTSADGQSPSKSRPMDIWDHIMLRWQEEDKVVEVLQKFV
ncbi:hypothetical protein BaRGS_00005697 [Batillaria attramentaria]|uniref:Uncharacterized protein n=1 Tax=Batillaria attramentaria TaxID=370345 RepID=A0ABD0LVF5_9CAEN